MVTANMTCARGGHSGPEYGSDQTLGDLKLEFAPPQGAVTGCRRSPDIGSAVAAVRYQAGEAVYTREIFSPAVRVPLSSIDPQSSAIGEQAGKLVLSLVESKSASLPKQIILDPHLVARASTRRAPIA